MITTAAATNPAAAWILLLQLLGLASHWLHWLGGGERMAGKVIQITVAAARPVSAKQLRTRWKLRRLLLRSCFA